MSNERLVALPVLLAALVATTVAVERVHLERATRQVALVADYGEVEALAAYADVPLGEALSALQKAGLTAVAVEEPLVDALVNNGVLHIMSRIDQDLLFLAGDSQQAKAAFASLKRRFGGRFSQKNESAVVIDAPPGAVLMGGAGLDPSAFGAVRKAGLEPIARLFNSPGLNANGIAGSLTEAKALGARVVVFSGDRVLGHRGLVAETAHQLAAQGLIWGRVEFAVQNGEQNLARELLDAGTRGSYARVHSIAEREMAKLAPELCVERYRRAAKERGIRLCWVRLALDPNADILETNSRFVQKIAGAIRAEGLPLGRAEVLPYRVVDPLRRAAVGALGVCAALAWVLVLLTGRPTLRAWALVWLVLAVLTTPVALVKPDAYAKVMALLAGLVFPALGSRWGWLRLTATPPRSVWGALGVLWGTVGWAALGGLLTVGLLSQTSFMLGHDTYLGVKVAHVVPLLAAAALVSLGVSLPGVDRAEAGRRWSSFWDQPVRTAHIGLAIVGLIMLVVLLVRSGNEGVEISETELRLRALLENVFGARPRTKEVLIGHPAMLLAGLLATQGRTRWLPLMFLLGVIGTISTFNTFCHIHTPLTQSLLRTGHALWMGSALGLVVWLFVRRRPEE